MTTVLMVEKLPITMPEVRPPAATGLSPPPALALPRFSSPTCLPNSS